MSITAAPASPSVTPVTGFVRRSSEWVTIEGLRGLLKQTLGYNTKQVSVKKGSSDRYLTLTVRDTAVDFAKVHAFAKAFSTFTVDETDYASGQSVSVEATKEYVAHHAAPYLEAVKAAVLAFQTQGLTENQGLGIEGTDYVLWLDQHGYYHHVAHRDLVGARGSETPVSDLRAGEAWAVQRLAADVAFYAALRAF